MKDVKKMVLLSWEKWESVKKEKEECKIPVSVDTVDVGVQTFPVQKNSDSLQGANAFGEEKHHEQGDLSTVSLPSPPAEFVKAYFEHGGQDNVKDTRKKKNRVIGKKLQSNKVNSSPVYQGKWVTLK